MVEIVKVGIVCIATGESYHWYARNLHASAKRYFPSADFILFSDMMGNPGVSRLFYTPPRGYPNETLLRYHTMMRRMDYLLEYDQIFYCDADMEFVASPENIYSPVGLTATLHPGFFAQNTKGTPETRPQSKAFCTNNVAYYCGGFQGGNAKEYIKTASILAGRISEDKINGVEAVWHDESHWNCYLASKPPETVLPPSYCYPEGYDGGYGWSRNDFPPILIAMDKRSRGNHPRFR